MENVKQSLHHVMVLVLDIGHQFIGRYQFACIRQEVNPRQIVDPREKNATPESYHL